jgi:lipoate synthase
MVELEMEKIRLGGLFSKSLKVVYQIKYERPAPEGETKSITMIAEDGRTLGKLEYTTTQTSAKINVFTINDWSTPKFGHALMKRFVNHMKKERKYFIEADLYATDDKTHDKLQIYKDHGFSIESGGSITGYNMYHLKRTM